MAMKLRWRNGYKSQTANTVKFQLPPELWPPEMIDTEFIRIDAVGTLTVRMGYSWDRASGPTNDHPYEHTVPPSLAHDALCQLHRQGKLDYALDARLEADKYFHKLLRDCGMGKARAWVWYQGVRWGAKMNKQKPKKIYEVLIP
jgi:hypothetical protein